MRWQQLGCWSCGMCSNRLCRRRARWNNMTLKCSFGGRNQPLEFFHLTTAIPVTVGLLCMHLSVEHKKKNTAVTPLPITATQGPPPQKSLHNYRSVAAGRPGDCPSAVQSSPSGLRSPPLGDNFRSNFAFCPPPLPSFTKRHFLPPDCGRSD